ncbi:MAG: translation elongation factor 4, partial [Dehalococcoidia bacterium]|nr:translation elongation factor 4 [Dehalococcoidia bacterium]
KIDLPNAEPEKVAREIEEVIGIKRSEIILASAKTGLGIREALEAVVKHIPPPRGNERQPLRALIFDSKYDSYKGVIAYVRLFDGSINVHDKIKMMSTGKVLEALEVGVFKPFLSPVERLSAGEVGYVATGLKNVRESQMGDTMTLADNPASLALPGYRPAKPMVFAGLYPVEGNDYQFLRDALDKLKLNDASLVYEPESSVALGFGFRCGFLGLLHMEIVQERLEREFDMNLLTTAPSVEYVVIMNNGDEVTIDNPANLPGGESLQEIREPWVNITVVSPSRYIGPIMELVTSRRGKFNRMEYLDSAISASGDSSPTTDKRVVLSYDVPLNEILIDFYDQLKTRTQGYASLDYTLLDYRAAKLVKLDILVNNQPVDALSLITHVDNAQSMGRQLVEKLRSLIPRQMFDVPVQAAIGSRVLARETIRALRKNVLDKCYGGDVSRKRKLLEKQAEGKKRMKRVGNVEIPQEAFMAVLRLGK